MLGRDAQIFLGIKEENLCLKGGTCVEESGKTNKEVVSPKKKSTKNIGTILTWLL